MNSKPFSQACENNKRPILQVLVDVLANAHEVLEIGSGTGQHAVFFADHLPHLAWQTSDLPEHHPGILAWLREADLSNLRAPLALSVDDGDWPLSAFDAVFTANTLHIVSWPQVQAMFKGIGRSLRSGGTCIIYGPFNYGGCYTSDSNARFDQWLKTQNPLSAIRDFEAVNQLAGDVGLVLTGDYEMPANNRTLVWVKQT